MSRRLVQCSSAAAAMAIAAMMMGTTRPPHTPPTRIAHAQTADKVVTTKSWSYYSGLQIADQEQFRLFTGNGNPALAREVSQYLGVSLSRAEIGRFADGEVNIQILDNVRGKDVYIIQSTSPPVSDNYMELLLMVSCLRRSSARRITVIMPYVGYARASVMQDAAVPISARAIADMLETMGVDRVVGIDLASAQMQGFFKPNVPTDNLEAVRVGANYFADAIELHQPIIVAIRTNTVQRARDFRDTLTRRGVRDANKHLQDARLGMVIRPAAATTVLATATTEREGEGLQEAVTSGIELVGFPEQIDGDVILVEDIIDTARTLCAAAHAVKQRGARNIYVFSTHGLFSKGASERIDSSPIDKVVVTNTVPRPESAGGENKIIRLSIAPLLAETIRRIHEKESLSDSAAFKKE
jgi:ribose-phosphate pyrophosphokinase